MQHWVCQQGPWSFFENVRVRGCSDAVLTQGVDFKIRKKVLRFIRVVARFLPDNQMSSKKSKKEKAKEKARREAEAKKAAAEAEEAKKEQEKYETPPEGCWPMMIEEGQMKK